MESLVCNRVPEGECEFIQVRGEGGEREKETWGVSSFFFFFFLHTLAGRTGLGVFH